MTKLAQLQTILLPDLNDQPVSDAVAVIQCDDLEHNYDNYVVKFKSIIVYTCIDGSIFNLQTILFLQGAIHHHECSLS